VSQLLLAGDDSINVTLHGSGLAALVIMVIAVSIALAVTLINYR
jgi:hypothetical protein